MIDFRAVFFVRVFLLLTCSSGRFDLLFLPLCFASFIIFSEPGTEMSRAGLRSKPSAEFWVEPRVSSLTGPSNRTEPRPGPKHQAKQSEPSWAQDKPSWIPNPEPRANPQLSPELGPELSLSRVPSWAKQSIELIPDSRAESQAQPEPRVDMSRAPNSESSRAALSRSPRTTIWSRIDPSSEPSRV